MNYLKETVEEYINLCSQEEKELLQLDILSNEELQKKIYDYIKIGLSSSHLMNGTILNMITIKNIFHFCEKYNLLFIDTLELLYKLYPDEGKD